jgi:hypothetical protein
VIGQPESLLEPLLHLGLALGTPFFEACLPSSLERFALQSRTIMGWVLVGMPLRTLLD